MLFILHRVDIVILSAVTMAEALLTDQQSIRELKTVY